MSPASKEIIFLNRAYNDLDIQFSLINSFAKDERFQIRVIGYPCDSDIGTPHDHEAVPYMKDKTNIRFETVLDKKPAPFYLRYLYKMINILSRARKKSWAVNPVIAFLLKIPHVLFLIVMRRLLKRDLPWLQQIAEKWNPAFIVCDEALAQTGRSYMLDKIVRDKAKQGVPVYVIQTGHMIYKDPEPNKPAQPPTPKKTPSKRFIVPNELGQKSISHVFPDEMPEIHGNLRMDKDWIDKLHSKILQPPYINKADYLRHMPEGSPKVVFMLSKLGYGIKLDEMKDTLRTVAKLPNIACAIKPHTRGMKFDFMDRKELGQAVIVPHIPSPLLIDWADIVLFTGSSIAFHAMLRGKRAGYLKNCQSLETIFDESPACDKFDSVSQLKTFLENWRDQGAPPQKTDQEWITKEVHNNLASGKTAEHYKDMILGDLGFNTTLQNAADEHPR